MNHAHFHVTDTTKDFVFLVDNGGENRSVTNDAEYVVEVINSRFPDRRIVYRDTEYQWEELKHKKGVFTDFALLSASDREIARPFLK